VCDFVRATKRLVGLVGEGPRPDELPVLREGRKMREMLLLDPLELLVRT
jgi:hypothetical protein